MELLAEDGGEGRGRCSFAKLTVPQAVCPALPGLAWALASILEGENQQLPPPSPAQAFLEPAGRESSASTAAFPQCRRFLTAPPTTTKMKNMKPLGFPNFPHARQDEGRFAAAGVPPRSLSWDPQRPSNHFTREYFPINGGKQTGWKPWLPLSCKIMKIL